jgi:hypothetical protein
MRLAEQLDWKGLKIIVEFVKKMQSLLILNFQIFWQTPFCQTFTI